MTSPLPKPPLPHRTSSHINMAASIRSLLHKDQIIPDLFPNEDGLDLQGRLDIMYPEHTVVPGEVIDRGVTAKQPHVRFQPFEGVNVDAQTRYTMWVGQYKG